MRPAGRVPAVEGEPRGRRRLRARPADRSCPGRRLDLVRRRRRAPGHPGRARHPPGGGPGPRPRRGVAGGGGQGRPAAAGLPDAPGPALAGIGGRLRQRRVPPRLRVPLQRGPLPRRHHRGGGRARSAAVHPRGRDRGAPAAAAIGAAVRHHDAGHVSAPAGRRRVRADPRWPAAQYPNDDVKRYFTYRNRGYLMAQPGMRWLFPLELVRFGYFFLSRGDVRGLRTWLRLTRAGRRALRPSLTGTPVSGGRRAGRGSPPGSRRDGSTAARAGWSGPRWGRRRRPSASTSRSARRAADRRADLRGLGPALGVVLPCLAAAVGSHVQQAEGPVGRLVAPARRGVGEEHAVAVAEVTEDVPLLRLSTAPRRTEYQGWG